MATAANCIARSTDLHGGGAKGVRAIKHCNLEGMIFVLVINVPNALDISKDNGAKGSGAVLLRVVVEVRPCSVEPAVTAHATSMSGACTTTDGQKGTSRQALPHSCVNQ